MKSFISFSALVFCIAASCSAPKNATENKPTASIDEAIQARNYTFKARTAVPTGGRTRQLTTDFDLDIGKDTIVSYLPYFGRAYTAQIGGRENGLQFTSTDFEYDDKVSENGLHEIRIKPKDARDVQLLLLSVSKNGYGTLQVTSTNRQPISFSGVVETNEK